MENRPCTEPLNEGLPSPPVNQLGCKKRKWIWVQGLFKGSGLEVAMCYTSQTKTDSVEAL